MVSSALDTVLAAARTREGSSDVHLSGRGATLRHGGRLGELGVTTEAVEAALAAILDDLLTPEETQRFAAVGHVTVRYASAEAGLTRIHVFRSAGEPRAAVRLLPNEIPAFDDLGFPESVREMVLGRSGLFLACGPLNAGKSTLVASLCREIDQRVGNRHIYQIDSTIEYLLQPSPSTVLSTIQVGTRRDSPTYGEAVRSALSADANVIAIGELFAGDDTIAACIEAADAGALVLATLHAPSVEAGLERLIDAMPAEKERRLRLLLSNVFLGGVSSRLIPAKAYDGRVVAAQVVRRTDAIAAYILRGEVGRIPDAVASGGAAGMQSLRDDVKRLIREGVIAEGVEVDGLIA